MRVSAKPTQAMMNSQNRPCTTNPMMPTTTHARIRKRMKATMSCSSDGLRAVVGTLTLPGVTAVGR